MVFSTYKTLPPKTTMALNVSVSGLKEESAASAAFEEFNASSVRILSTGSKSTAILTPTPCATAPSSSSASLNAAASAEF
ncbi:hypothetical protein D3C81_2106380 [compost metagenome]